MERTAEALSKLENMHRKQGEDLKSFTIRFDSAVIEVQGCAENEEYLLHERYLVVKLLDNCGLTEQEKSNVLVLVNQENEEEVYKEMKDAMRKVKGILTKGTDNEARQIYVGEHKEDKASKMSKEEEEDRVKSEEDQKRQRRYSEGERGRKIEIYRKYDEERERSYE